MKSLAIMTAAAALVTMLSLPQGAEAKTVYVPVYVPQNNIQVGVPAAELGGATINPDGSFSNNGYSWNGADPAGGWTGRYYGGRWNARRAAAVYRTNRVIYRPVYHVHHHHR